MLSEMPMLRCYADGKCYLKICSPNAKKLFALESELLRVMNMEHCRSETQSAKIETKPQTRGSQK
jgi:hypothetical protein